MAVCIGFWVLPRTWVLLKSTMNILLEGVPEEVDLNKLNEAMQGVKGVANVHDLHVWAISSGKICLTAHVVIEQTFNDESVLSELRERLASDFDITHTTLQRETQICMDAQKYCLFQ